MLKNTCNNRGFTLYEIVISLIIMSVLILVIFSMLGESARGVSNSYEMMDYVDDLNYLEKLVYNDLKFNENVVYYINDEKIDRVEFTKGADYVYVYLQEGNQLVVENAEGTKVLDNFVEYEIDFDVRDRLFIIQFYNGEIDSFEIKLDLGVANIESR